MSVGFFLLFLLVLFSIRQKKFFLVANVQVISLFRKIPNFETPKQLLDELFMSEIIVGSKSSLARRSTSVSAENSQLQIADRNLNCRSCGFTSRVRSHQIRGNDSGEVLKILLMARCLFSLFFWSVRSGNNLKLLSRPNFFSQQIIYSKEISLKYMKTTRCRLIFFFKKIQSFAV